MSSNELVYAVQQSNDEIFKISVVYDIHYFANFRPNVSQVKPDRVKGFKLLVKLPDSLKDIKKVGVIDEKN